LQYYFVVQRYQHSLRLVLNVNFCIPIIKSLENGFWLYGAGTVNSCLIILIKLRHNFDPVSKIFGYEEEKFSKCFRTFSQKRPLTFDWKFNLVISTYGKSCTISIHKPWLLLWFGSLTLPSVLLFQARVK